MNKYCTIQGWYGRFGNNIQQISNGIFFALQNKIGFVSPEHQLINGFRLNVTEPEICLYKSNFFNFVSCSNNDWTLDFSCDVNKLNEIRYKIVKNIIQPNLKINITDIRSFDDDVLVVHIRTGDIFSSNPHRLYVQNPLDFYKNLINKFRKTIIVCENRNFLIEELCKIDTVTVCNGNLEQDLITVLSAKNLVSSGVGTFVIAAGMLSNNLKNFYCTNIYLEDHLNPNMLDPQINIHMSQITNYINIGEWGNTQEQQSLMLNYKLEI
jgi:hypothetical protein